MCSAEWCMSSSAWPLCGVSPSFSGRTLWSAEPRGTHEIRKARTANSAARAFLLVCFRSERRTYFLILAQGTGVVAAGGLAQVEVVAGQDGVEDDARDGSDGQGGQGDGGRADLEGQAVREAQAADQDDRSDDEVAAVGEFHVVLHHVPHADGGDHAVEDEAHAADDGGGDGVDQVGKGGGEGQNDGVNGRQPDHTGVVDAGEDQHAGVLAVSGVGGAAEQTGQGRGDAVTDQGAVQAGVLDEVLPHGSGDGGHVADVLHHGGDGDGGHDQDGGQVKLGHAAGEVLQEGLEAQHGVFAGEQGAAGKAGEIDHPGAQGDHIAADHAQQDGDDLDHAAAPDVGHDDDGHGNQRQPPAAGGVGHGGGGQVQADEDNNGAGDHGGQEVHHAVDTHGLDDGGEDHIQQAGDDDAAAGILQFFRRLHRGVHAGA